MIVTVQKKPLIVHSWKNTNDIPTYDTLYNGIFSVNTIGKGINISYKLVFHTHLICFCEIVL